jgi:hypothetical protein
MRLFSACFPSYFVTYPIKHVPTPMAKTPQTRKVGRPPKPVAVTSTNLPGKFEPAPRKSTEPIILEPAEVEASNWWS